MDPGETPAKTDKGRAEVARRSGLLTAVQRRLLILIDGNKTVNDLGAYARVGELESALDVLLGHGLIDFSGPHIDLELPPADGYSAPMPLEPERPATSIPAFIHIREDAARFVHNRLGRSGDPICAAIERCESPQELRTLLRGIEVFVGQRLDRETTQAFARHFGSLLL